MTHEPKNILFWLLSVFLFLYFWLKGALFLDPDFGWHLTMGKYILAHGIPLTDPFSYTMPSYPFVDHEWLTNVLIAKGVGFLSYDGVAGIFALLTCGALLLSLATVQKKFLRFAFMPFLLAGLTYYSFAGVRPQVITWFFFALLLWVIRREKHFLRFRWYLPLVFVAWVNLHGGFALGIMTLFLACVYWYSKRKSSLKSLVSLFSLCLLATCITPYGVRMWWEVWMQMTDSTLRFAIQEWLPAIFSLDLTLWLFAAVSVILVLRHRRQFSFLDQVLYGCLLVSAVSSVRHMPLWFLIALPLTVEAIAHFFAQVVKIPEGERRFRIMGKALFVLTCLFALPSLWLTAAGLGWLGRGQTSMYPDKAVNYVVTHQTKGEVFSTYDWGGYLIWKNPSKKVFIDGRMPSWRWQGNRVGESNYAFVEYRDVSDGKIPFETIINKYHIQTLLLPVPPPPAKDSVIIWLKQFGNQVLHLKLREEVAFDKLVKSAQKVGWRVVYQDETAVIYQEKKYELGK